MGDAHDPRERRGHPRLEVLGALPGDIMVLHPMQVRDISARGVLIDTGVPLQVDSLHEVRLALGEHAIVVRARVVHCSVDDVGQDEVVYRSGLEFVETSAQASAVVSRFVASVRLARRPG